MNPLGSDRLDRMLDLACVVYRGRTALKGGADLTYGQLADGALRIRDELVSLGITTDEPIAVVIGNAAPDLVAFYGVWKAGGVAVPVHTKAAAATVDDILSRTGARFAVRGSSSVIWPAGMASQSNGVLTSLKDSAPPPREILRDAAFIIFTSGSTGRPKGVVLGHRAFARKLQAIQSVIPFRGDSSTLLILQLTFSFGQWVTLLTLATGGTVHLMTKFDPLLSLQAMTEHRITRVAAVPTMMRCWAAVDADRTATSLFDTLRGMQSPELIIAGGEPLPGPLGVHFRRRLPRSAIADVFGLTETSTSDFILPPDKYDQYPGTIGWPTPGVMFRVVDNNENDVAVSQAGELRIRSPYIMNGYLDDYETTRASFDGQYLRTGDLAMVTESGALMLIGRQTEIIVRGGNKISPLELERIFAEHPAVVAALATGVPDELVGERIHLLVVPQQGVNLSEEDLRQWAFDRIDRFKLPDRVHFGADLPLGRTGKADRHALRRWIIENDPLHEHT